MPKVATYQGPAAAADDALAGGPAGFSGIGVLIRPLGMRFSGFLLMALAAVLLAEGYLRRWARRAKTGWWCQLAFRAALGLVLIPLVLIEACVIHEGRKAPPENPPTR